MKSQSQFLSNGRSLFSLNTVNTIQAGQATQINELHQFYHQLMQEETYPNLCKILFLQLVLRENVLIYSNRRVEIKEVWNSLNKRLAQKVGNIYIVDQLTKIEDILANTSEYKRALLYDLTEISNAGLNYLLNQQETVTLTVVESQNKVLRSELTDLFPFIFHYDGETEDMDLLGSSQAKEKKEEGKFEKDKFYDCVTSNFNQTLEVKEEEGFLKTYLAILKEKTAKLNIPYSRWKKMLKVLHFIGLTKCEGSHKRFSLTDCLLAPECLGRTCSEIQDLRRINQQTILLILPYFGTQKWLKQLSSHFWVDTRTKRFFTSLAEKLRGKVSFFYPCSKYPETVKLQYDNSTIYYRVSGFDKKLMSDKYYEVEEGKQYQLQLKYRSQSSVVMHFGVACYDQDKNLIHPVQVCRFEQTAATVQQIDSSHLICSQNDSEAMGKWKNSGTLAYERCIGFYYDGNLNKFLTIEDILYSQADSYSNFQQSGVYSKVDQNTIELTEKGAKMLSKIKDRIKLGLTKVVNHFEGGTYAICRSQAEKNENWKQVCAILKGCSRVNTGKQFLMGTKYVRIVIMSNYNSGYPQFKIENKAAQVDLKDIEWNRS